MNHCQANIVLFTYFAKVPLALFPTRYGKVLKEADRATVDVEI